MEFAYCSGNETFLWEFIVATLAGYTKYLSDAIEYDRKGQEAESRVWRYLHGVLAPSEIMKWLLAMTNPRCIQWISVELHRR